MVLYEVTVSAEKKAPKGQTVNLRPPDKRAENAGIGEEKSRHPAVSITRRPLRRRRTRIKIATFVKKKKLLTVRNLAAAVVLLMFVMVIWIGQGKKDSGIQDTGGIALPEIVVPIISLSGIDIDVPEVEIEEIVASPVPAKGNVIVIASNTVSDQLGPLAEYFQGKGIETVIRKTGNRHVLITVDRFSGKSDPEFGKLKKRIEQIGENYKAPQGFKSFGFDSIYLLNVSKIE